MSNVNNIRKKTRWTETVETEAETIKKRDEITTANFYNTTTLPAA